MAARIGFAGLGLMGSRMAAGLLRKGFPLTVWNRSAERAAGLLADGASLAASPRELAERSDIVVCCVADPRAVERVVFAADGVLAGARAGLRYVETSTVTPELTRRVETALRERGAEMLEAPVTGSKQGAANGTLLFMVGGKKALLMELEPVLMAMGSRAIHCGEVGAGSMVKLVGNSLISFMLEGLAEGVVVARKFGVPMEKVLEVVMASGYASPYYAFKGEAIRRRDFEQHFSIELLVKDQTLMLAEAAAQGASMPGLAAVREVFQAARGQGWGQEDIAAVIKPLERAAGLDI